MCYNPNYKSSKEGKGLLFRFYFRKIGALNGYEDYTVFDADTRMIDVLKEILDKLEAQGSKISLDQIAVVDFNNYVVLSKNEIYHYVASLSKWLGTFYIITSRDLVEGEDLSVPPEDPNKREPRPLKSYKELLAEPDDHKLPPRFLNKIF
ncbi:MAG: hypothetical protein ACTSU2_08180 [Promethearchaeota archaeon]